MAATVSSVTLVRYGRSPSLPNMSASTPPALRFSISAAQEPTSHCMPRFASYWGEPGKGGKCNMAMMGLAAPKVSLSILVLSPSSFTPEGRWSRKIGGPDRRRGPGPAGCGGDHDRKRVFWLRYLGG